MKPFIATYNNLTSFVTCIVLEFVDDGQYAVISPVSGGDRGEIRVVPVGRLHINPDVLYQRAWGLK